MDLYSAELLGHRHLAQQLSSMPTAVRGMLLDKAQIWSDMLYNGVQANMLNFKGGTGKLSRALKQYVEETGTGISVGVSIDLNEAPHARIQDKGGVIPAHIIRPRMAKKLAFFGATGEKVIVAQVFHPGAVIPPTHYMRDAKQNLSPQVAKEMKKAVIDGIRAHMRSQS